jgi:hypothetical protein
MTIKMLPPKAHFLAAFISFLSINTASAQNLQVLRILPAGENVTQTDSVNITFSKPMVALGEFEKTRV